MFLVRCVEYGSLLKNDHFHGVHVESRSNIKHPPDQQSQLQLSISATWSEFSVLQKYSSAPKRFKNLVDLRDAWSKPPAQQPWDLKGQIPQIVINQASLGCWPEPSPPLIIVAVTFGLQSTLWIVYSGCYESQISTPEQIGLRWYQCLSLFELVFISKFSCSNLRTSPLQRTCVCDPKEEIRHDRFVS